MSASEIELLLASACAASSFLFFVMYGFRVLPASLRFLLALVRGLYDPRFWPIHLGCSNLFATLAQRNHPLLCIRHGFLGQLLLLCKKSEEVRRLLFLMRSAGGARDSPPQGCVQLSCRLPPILPPILPLFCIWSPCRFDGGLTYVATASCHMILPFMISLRSSCWNLKPMADVDVGGKMHNVTETAESARWPAGQRLAGESSP